MSPYWRKIQQILVDFACIFALLKSNIENHSLNAFRIKKDESIHIPDKSSSNPMGIYRYGRYVAIGIFSVVTR